MSSRDFRHLFLFHTRHTRANAAATEKEVSTRYPDCQIVVRELPVSDPKDYSALMGRLARMVPKLIKLGSSEVADCYVCVSSGTAEMRAAWFLLTALGVLPAKLLQVGSPSRPLFGEANVKEVRMDAGDWQAISELALPAEYFRGGSDEWSKEPPVPLAARPIGRSWWPRRAAKDAEAPSKAKSVAALETFEKAFGERMRIMYGDAFTDYLLPALRTKLQRNELLFSTISPDELRDLAREAFRKFAARVPEHQRADPAALGVLLDSIGNELLIEAYRPSGVTRPARQSHLDATETATSPAPLPEPWTMLGRAKESPPHSLAAEKDTQEVTEPPETAAEEIADDMHFLAEPKLEGLTLGAPSTPSVREPLTIPGLDDALLELGVFVGSALLRHAAEQAGIAAGSHLPVLLVGETGTGKERFAHLIHRLSPRSPREMVAVNCAAIPASLAESYLFGHLRGAFTGATCDAKGIFEIADQGTLFLDEVAELTLEIQAKLLRVIQDGVVQRLGSTTPRKVDLRIIAASNRDLRKEVSAGRFRQDLYFRLEVVQIKLPPLRDRRAEIPELALMLLRQINQRRHKPRQLTKAALARLERYPWPGNVRDLLNVLERSVLYSCTDLIDANDLRFNDDSPATNSLAVLPEPSKGFKIDAYLTQVRHELFQRALETCKGNQTEAAELLGVSKQAVSKFVQGQNDKEN